MTWDSTIAGWVGASVRVCERARSCVRACVCVDRWVGVSVGWLGLGGGGGGGGARSPNLFSAFAEISKSTDVFLSC